MSLFLLFLFPIFGDDALDAVIQGEHRSADNKARDAFRHPKETLTFFGIKPDMTVIEIWPGGGWYEEILAPYLNEKGQYISAGFSPNEEGRRGEFFNKALAKQKERFAAKNYSNAKVSVFNPPNEVEIAPDGSVDMILTFRNVHNWMPKGHQDLAFETFFKALKSGGVLGVVEHRGLGGEQDPEAPSGYVNEDYVIELAKKAGFELVEKSEINANAKDMKNYEKGVWSLPPTLAMGEKDQEKFKGIGESDRMTLKFMKP